MLKNNSFEMFAELNQGQRDAVLFKDGHLLIVAGPGTGKTHTLMSRTACLTKGLRNGQKVLAVTFTNKAAEEMRQRLQSRFPVVNSRVDVETFHSFALKLLRRFRGVAGVPQDFRIASTEDVECLLMPFWGSSVKKDLKERVNRVALWKIKCEGEAPQEVQEYQRILRDAGMFDFDDLILECLRLFQDAPETIKAVREEYPYLCADEYQDINRLQHEFLKVLIGDSGRLTAIGDPCQAIYGFRGSDVRYFETFVQDFSPATVFRLSENYRSASQLLQASGQVIAKDVRLDVPALTANILSSGSLTIYEAATEKAEAEYVVHQIEKLIGGTSMFSYDSGRVERDDDGERSFGDIAVLYRLNSLRVPLQQALERSGIPYKISGAAAFLEETPACEILGLMRLAARQRVSSTLCRAITDLFMLNVSLSGDKSLGLKSGMIDSEEWQNALGSHGAEISLLFDRLCQIREPAQQVDFILASDIWHKVVEQSPSLAEDGERIKRLAGSFQSLERFFDYADLQRPEDQRKGRSESVSLMTLHASKGLEFDVVFIIGCEDGIIPCHRDNEETDLREERRLLYVGMTRAKRKLYLLRSKKRTLYGKTITAPASVFLADIEEELKEHAKQQEMSRKKKQARDQFELFKIK